MAYFKYDKDKPCLYLGSGSQDGTIRLWIIESLSASSPLAVFENHEKDREQILDSLPSVTQLTIDGSAYIRAKQHVFKITMENGTCVLF